MKGSQRQATVAAAPSTDQGPVGFVLAIVVGGVFTTLFSWTVSIAIEMVGMHYFWPDRGMLHSRDLVMEDLGYIAEAPHSLIVADTVAFSKQLMGWVATPFKRLGVTGFYERSLARAVAADQAVAGDSDRSSAAKKVGVDHALQRASAQGTMLLATLGVVAMFTAQDTALRLAIVVFALPAFVLACLLGAVDGLVRRDLRKWGGGRESSFIYHHAKATTYLTLGGGFGLYLAWPTGGFNPAYMVLVFTALVAWSLSLTLSSFKKYL